MKLDGGVRLERLTGGGCTNVLEERKWRKKIHTVREYIGDAGMRCVSKLGRNIKVFLGLAGFG